MSIKQNVSSIQIILFLFAVVFIILGAIGKSPKLTYSLGGALVILAAFGPDNIKEFSLKLLGLKITRHVETPEVTKKIIELVTTESDQPIADDPLVKAAESRSSEEKAATDYLLLARAAWEEKHFDEGIGFAHQGLNLDSEQSVKSGLENLLGVLHDDIGNQSDAVIYYKLALKSDPFNPKPVSNLGIGHYKEGRFDLAEVAHRKAIDLDPNYVPGYNSLGATLKSLGRQKEAEVAYRKAIELDSDFASAHFNLSLLLTELGQEEEAKAEYKIAINLNPSLGEEK